MKYVLIIGFFLIGNNLQAQKISTVDIIKGKAQYEKEVDYFYEANWKAFRKEALKQKKIIGYQMWKSAIDSTGHFALVLITEYKDSIAFNKMEEAFRPIMKKISPNGPKMLNQIPRSSILEYVNGYTMQQLQ